MVAKIKEQFKETIEWSKNVQKRLKGTKSSRQNDFDVHHILESLFKQVDRDKDQYIKQVDVCKQRYISDSETIKMALTKLMTSLEHEQEISKEKASRLQELLQERSCPTFTVRLGYHKRGSPALPQMCNARRLGTVLFY